MQENIAKISKSVGRRARFPVSPPESTLGAQHPKITKTQVSNDFTFFVFA